MKTNDYFDFEIAEHFLPALINGDDSGLTNDESKLLDEFVDHWQSLDSATWDVLPVGNDFTVDYITGLYATTETVRLYYYNDKLPVGWSLDANEQGCTMPKSFFELLIGLIGFLVVWGFLVILLSF